MPDWEELRANLVAWLMLAFVSALPVLGLWFWAGRGGRLLGPPRQRFVPWSGFEVCLVFFVVVLLLPASLHELLNRIGFFNWLYGPDFESAPGTGEPGLESIRRVLWVSVLAFPLQVLGTLGLLRGLSGTRLYQLGLTTYGAIRNLTTGWLAWLVLTPPVLALHLVVVQGFWVWEGVPPEKHALARLAQEQPSLMEWMLIAVSGVVVAPVLEELLFRGVLQGWAARRRWGGAITLATALILMCGTWMEKITNGWDTLTLAAALHDGEPVLFVLILIPGCWASDWLFRRWLDRPYAMRAIYSTAVLFAVSHVNVWPTPIPLFVLGLGLGYAAYRTQSLLGPILMHALFNSVACILMLTTHAGG